MASDFALPFLSPVGYKTSKLHRLLIDFQVQAQHLSPAHYGRRLATMPSADFCLIINKVALVDAIGFHRVRSFQSMTLKSQGIYRPEPDWWVTDCLLGRPPHDLGTPLWGVRT